MRIILVRIKLPLHCSRIAFMVYLNMIKDLGREGEAPENPIFKAIDSQRGAGSVREIVGSALQMINKWDLPEDPDELKKVLSDAVDYAVATKRS
jgi:hypothetical protein